ncbi:pentapeptide repeat-containing protein [Amycolatopsis sp. lyj-112]|uniref:pentapeptide repeat-containing protein n=1 Tax=Amycolatopsis sp. lyj-112 TaxID=2789288 RepID=UPI00397DE59A
MIVLWWPATAGLTGADLVKARLDALKIGLSIGVGSGGVVALYLAWRRQHSTEADLDNRERALAHQQDVAAATQAHQERVADDARADAVERRITELYTKAVEQLGSDKAPVRLGGLYALERLAQGNETQRQTIVNVFCAYLRMPYDLPDEQDHEEGASAEQFEIYRARAQEREVRLTAQRLLSEHLKPNRGPVYWGDLDLDLTGAQLINFNFNDVRMRTGNFYEATFAGDTWFERTTFSDYVVFSSSTFAGYARFGKAAFIGDAIFLGATFTDDTAFHQATFASEAWFEHVTFLDDAWFGDVTFTGEARFGSARFTGEAWFIGATFAGEALFDEATRGGDSRPFHPSSVSSNSTDSGQPG